MSDFQFKQPTRFRKPNRQIEDEKRAKSGTPGGIPDRWLDYLGVNTVVENTRFVAFKCPLKPEMQVHLPEDRRFTLGHLVEKLDDKGFELGVIIDLTNTDRYYKADAITAANIEYHKLSTPGHHTIPSDVCYNRFVDIVKLFLNENKHNEKLIGVHCTHGLNRTGYLVVRYMIEHMGIDPEEALEAFNRSRAHAMEKYTDDLLMRCAIGPTSIKDSSSTSSSLSSSMKIQTVQTDNWPLLFEKAKVVPKVNDSRPSSASSDQQQQPSRYRILQQQKERQGPPTLAYPSSSSSSSSSSQRTASYGQQPPPPSFSTSQHPRSSYNSAVNQQFSQNNNNAGQSYLSTSRGYNNNNNGIQVPPARSSSSIPGQYTNNNYSGPTAQPTRSNEEQYENNDGLGSQWPKYYGATSGVGRGRPKTNDR